MNILNSSEVSSQREFKSQDIPRNDESSEKNKNVYGLEKELIMTNKVVKWNEF